MKTLKFRFKIPAESTFRYAFGDWSLYELKPAPSSCILWPGFKLMMPPGTKRRRGHKRSFWLYWSPIEMRFRRDWEHKVLLETEPDLYAAVELYLSLNYNRDWLLRYADEDEIEAEQGKLAARRAQRIAEAQAAKAAL